MHKASFVIENLRIESQTELDVTGPSLVLFDQLSKGSLLCSDKARQGLDLVVQAVQVALSPASV